MNASMFEISVAIAMVAISAFMIVWLLGYLSKDSRRRMKRMLKRVGLDPEIADHGDRDSIMHAVRQRCRRCKSEDYCERWLAGEETGDNAFCPNAKIFEQLNRTAGSTG